MHLSLHQTYYHLCYFTNTDLDKDYMEVDLLVQAICMVNLVVSITGFTIEYDYQVVGLISSFTNPYC